MATFLKQAILILMRKHKKKTLQLHTNSVTFTHCLKGNSDVKRIWDVLL